MRLPRHLQTALDRLSAAVAAAAGPYRGHEMFSLDKSPLAFLLQPLQEPFDEEAGLQRLRGCVAAGVDLDGYWRDEWYWKHDSRSSRDKEFVHERTPAQSVARRGDARWIALLHAAGADVHRPDKDGQPSIVLATLAGNVQAIDMLMLLGADVEARSVQGDQVPSGCTPLIMAARIGQAQRLQALLQHGADVEARDVQGRTALWHAVDLDRPAAVVILFEAGAKPFWSTVSASGEDLDAGWRAVRAYCEDNGKSKVLDVLGPVLAAAAARRALAQLGDEALESLGLSNRL